MTRGFAVLACCLALGSISGSAQTLPEFARLHGGSATTVIDIDGPISRPGELMSLADLVIHGRITSVDVRLNADQSEVLTQYTVEPIQAFKQRTTDTVGSPGMVAKVIVERSGGVLTTEDGLRLSTNVNIFPESESFRVGEEVLFFLNYRPGTKMHTFTNGEFGAYRIKNGMASLMTMTASKRRRDTPTTSTALFADLVRARGGRNRFVLDNRAGADSLVWVTKRRGPRSRHRPDGPVCPPGPGEGDAFVTSAPGRDYAHQNLPASATAA
jgi:hypothetical protein